MFQIPELLSSIACGIAAIIAAIVVVAKLSRGPDLDAIPTVGSKDVSPGTWWGGLSNITNAVDAVQEGYDKHKSAPFKIYDRFRWLVVVSKREHIEQVVRAPEDVLSFVEGTDERINTRTTLGHGVHDNPLHIAALRSRFPRNSIALYPEIRDEISAAFDEVLDLPSNDWKGAPALNLAQKVVCRASNRLFVGLPLCRHPDWIDLNIRYTIDVVKAGFLLGMFPKFMRPLAARFFTSVNKNLESGLKHLGPIIEERLRCIDEHRNDDVPNDLLSWVMEDGGNSRLTPRFLTSLILSINFAAIHTTSMSFTHTLFYLAANPQYVQPLREEVESIVEKDGWSKAALSKMRKVDSFIRECLRLEGVSAISVIRKVLKDFTLSDGTLIPSGVLLAVASRCVHHEERFYENGNVFKPFRFVDEHADDDEVAKAQFASTAIDYLVFGHGKHACPGRFFAASELKSMLAHLVVTYDIKLEDNATQPRSLHVSTSVVADPRAKVLFRKRAE